MFLRNASQRILLTLCTVGLVVSIIGATTERADAQSEPIQNVIPGAFNVITGAAPGILTKDVGLASQGILTRIWNFAQKRLKTATDIAFQNASRQFLARVVQESAIQLATAGPGQKPLFLTTPQTFFRDVGNAAAGDFIDGFQRGITGGSLNSQGIAVGGQTFGRSKEELFSDAQQRFVISRILRAAAGDPVQSCQEQCRVDFAVRKTTGNLAELNQHERNIGEVKTEIAKTEQAEAKDPKANFACLDVAIYPCLSAYCGWEIYVSSTPWPGSLTPSQCLYAQREAVSTEHGKATAQLKPCLTECRNGVAGAAKQAITSFTATDIFSAVENADVRQAPADIANALSNSKSGVGQLLGAFGALTATVQERIIGEDTNLRAGVLPKTSKVSKKVQTPKEATSALFGVPFYNSAGQLTYTGTGPADILKGIASFLNSPIGKALTTYFKSKCGLNPDSCKGQSNPTSTFGQLLFGSGASGIAGAQLQFASLGKAELVTGDPGRSEVAVTEELTSAGLIDAQFRSAIDEQLTVREALEKNLLDPKKTFGFDQNGIEPRSGYSFRSLQYLRKYRVIPVGWELAARYSQQFGHRALSLGFLTGAFNLCGQNNLVCSNDSAQICSVDADCNVAPASGNTCGLKSGDQSHSICTGGNKPDQSCLQDRDCGTDSNGVAGRCTASPYCGLVDPDWVLKAPQTYCRRLGAGEEIVSREFVCDQNNIRASDGAPIPTGVEDPGPPDITGKPDPKLADNKGPNCNAVPGNIPDIGRWVIERNADTCADVQSCIAENDDGTCQAFGYCVQERQTFKFNGTQCSAENASCTLYTDDSGQQVSYLASTLDFQGCSADVAGCQEYATGTCSLTGALCQTNLECGAAGGTCAGAGTIRLTNQAASCTQSQVGCRQYIRTTNGSNILSNGSFETIANGGPVDSGNAAIFTGWSTGVAMQPVTSDEAGTAVKVVGSGTFSQPVDAVVKLYEKSYTASIRAKTGSCTATLKLAVEKSGGGFVETTAPISPTGTWQTFSATLSLPAENQGVSLKDSNLIYSVTASGCTDLIIDSAQLEVSASPTAYKDYGAINNIYLGNKKLLCNPEDVGCELYTPVNGSPKVTAVANNSNRCSSDNVGCANFTMEPITTTPQRTGGPVTIVAPRGQICSAADVGCEEYTNLDLAAQGGEAKEYFKAIKQCLKPSQVKPGDPASPAEAATYYTWVGDPDRGFVLRAYDLVKSNVPNINGRGYPPCTNLSLESVGVKPKCQDTNVFDSDPICNPTTLATNPDCRQYYDQALNVFYRLGSQTVSITDNCHPFRNTIDGNSLIYNLSPNENLACPAAAASCRAYTGNAGKTTRKIFTETFEKGGIANWIGVTLSSAATSIGGHSMKVTPASIAFTSSPLTSGQFTKGKAYLLTFTAAAATSGGATVTASLGTGSGAQYTELSPSLSFSGSAVAQWNGSITPPGPEWNTFTLGPLSITNDPTGDLRLGLKTAGDVYVDNIMLTEVNDKLYLINTAVPICPDTEVGCAAYRDRQGQLQYFKSFTRICSEQVVACEVMIDTQNSSTPFAQTVKGVTTLADEMVTYVNNPGAYCPAAAKGCSALGQPTYLQDFTLSGYRPVYLKNDPDTHSRDLCEANEVFCRAYSQADGSAAFFKDPISRTCEFRPGSSDTGGQWFISGTNFRCPTVTPPQSGRPVGPSCAMTCSAGDRTGKACVSNTDCPNGQCAGDASLVGKITGDVFGQCSIDPNSSTDNCAKDASAPDNKCVYYAGTCPDDQNGCSEFRDPGEPLNCRSECPLELQGASPVLMDATCQVTRCVGGPNDGQNCVDSSVCGTGGSCEGGGGTPAIGVPGCRSYFYLRQSIEDQAVDCNGQINLATGCRPFNDTSKSTLNFRGQ